MGTKTYYYKDELKDDFAGTNIKQKDISPKFKYFHNPFRRAWVFFVYYVIVRPIVTTIQKITFHEKIVGKKKLKVSRKTGYFLYGNHTRAMGDAFAPTTVTFPKKAYIIVNPDAFSLPFISFIVDDLGGVPLPTSISGMKNYVNAIRKHCERNHVITIYPEAHIWPFYTGIRAFKDTSFKFPAELNKPVYTFTTTYHKRKRGDKPKTVVYVDGPFYADENLSVKENQKLLRDKAYNAMVERSKLSTYEINKFIKIDDQMEKPNIL